MKIKDSKHFQEEDPIDNGLDNGWYQILRETLAEFAGTFILIVSLN